jgi:hypothetical protein
VSPFLLSKCLFPLSNVLRNTLLSLSAVFLLLALYLFHKNAFHSASVFGQFSETGLSLTVGLIELSTVLLGEFDVIKLLLFDISHLLFFSCLGFVEESLHPQEVVTLLFGLLFDEVFSFLINAFHIFDFFNLPFLILNFTLLLLFQGMVVTFNVELVYFVLMSLVLSGLFLLQFLVSIVLDFLVSEHIVNLLLFLL